MRNLLLVAFIGLLAVSISLRPSQAPIVAASTIEPFQTAITTVHVLRAERTDKRVALVKAARSAMLRAALNLGAWGCLAGYLVARSGRRMPISPIWHE